MMTWREIDANRTPPHWIIDNWEIFTVLLGSNGQLYLPSDKTLLLLWQGTKAITSARANNLLVPPCVCVCVYMFVCACLCVLSEWPQTSAHLPNAICLLI